jgi:hypothetical protein
MESYESSNSCKFISYTDNDLPYYLYENDETKRYPWWINPIITYGFVLIAIFSFSWLFSIIHWLIAAPIYLIWLYFLYNLYPFEVEIA